MAKATKASTKKRSSKKASAKPAAASTRGASAPNPPAAPRKASAKKVAKKTASKKKAAVKKTAPKKTAAKKTVAKTTVAKKTVAKPAAAKNVVAKKTVGKKALAKRASGRTRKAAGATPATWNAVASAAPGPQLVIAGEEAHAPKAFQRQYKTWLQRLIGLRRRLLGETTQLEEEALRAAEGDVSIDHMADYGSDSFEQEFTLSLIESKSEALRDVDEAIRKIDVGSYGLCEECETLIPRGRLEVLPHTPLCIECKSAQESADGF